MAAEVGPRVARGELVTTAGRGAAVGVVVRCRPPVARGEVGIPGQSEDVASDILVVHQTTTDELLSGKSLKNIRK